MKTSIHLLAVLLAVITALPGAALAQDAAAQSLSLRQGPHRQ
ncbi:MAG: hypothetical protein R3E68_06835 [Burkholderiaceae bacterium]